MRIVSVSTLRQWQVTHPDARDALANWFKFAKSANWRNLHEVRQDYASADQVDCCLVFNIKGNQYRLIVRVRYANSTHCGTLFLKQFLTHAEYSKNAWRKDCT